VTSKRFRPTCFLETFNQHPDEKITWKYNLPLNEPGSLYRSEVKTLEPCSEAHLGAGPILASKVGF
ncbi:MAG: hypothetical protein V5A79_04430, partial [Candidatus Bipolaricaulota bacterium]